MNKVLIILLVLLGIALGMNAGAYILLQKMQRSGEICIADHDQLPCYRLILKRKI